MLPPPKFSPLQYPYQYNYRQNAGVTVVSDGKGGSKIINLKVQPKLFSIIIGANDPSPEGPSKELESQPITDPNIHECIAELKKLFDKRPIWTRRALRAELPKEYVGYIKFSIARVAYGFRGGPWRSTSIKFGVDPRSDPKYRFYQIRTFRLIVPDEEEPNPRVRRTEAKPYEFDGKQYPGKPSFQICDVIEPQLKKLYEECPVRETPSSGDGWFESRQYERVGALFRAKYLASLEGTTLTESQIEEILTRERPEGDGNEIEDEENDDSDSEPEDSVQAREFADKLEQSEKTLSTSENDSSVSKTHNQVSTMSKEDNAKVQDLFGYVQQQSASTN